jgi:pimeloyl-ACP methyl ester carboxylesterase
MPKVKVGDINIYYEEYGIGEPLVIISGASSSTQGSSRLIPIYSNEFRLIIFDKRGEGQSDKPDMPYSTEMMADDVAGLLDAINIDSAHINGTSLGGMIAQQIAIRHPGKVRSLILVSTYCGGPHSIPFSTEAKKVADKARAGELTAEESVRETIRLFITKEFIDKNPGFVQRMMAQMSAQPNNNWGQQQGEASLAHNAYELLPDIKAPTLVIHGDADMMLPVENARILASRIPGAELVIFKNAGHFLIESGEEKNLIMLDFLRRQSIKRA